MSINNLRYMKQILLPLCCFVFCLPSLLVAQNNNGQLDMLEEFSVMETVPVAMPDGIKLKTDVFRPVTQDSQRVTIQLPDLPIIGTPDPVNLELIPKGVQLFIYDSVNGQKNPNPYQLPMLFTRTPYSKKGDVVGRIVSLMGYSYALQDMRGRYTSEGVYFPMYSDSWNKNPYHNTYGHVLDVTPLNDPRNGNRHEDGYNSVQFLANDFKQWYDLDGDGVKETYDYVNNGSIGMFGASALANTQLQAAAAHKVDPNARGLKCLFPIVGTVEHYRYTGYQNGVFRDRIVTGWLRGQLADTDDDANLYDFDINNDIHSSNDYGVPSKFVASNKAIDHFATVRYDNQACGYYPWSVGRSDMDASHAPVNANGEAVAADGFTPLTGLTHSRYENMDVPVYHLTGWYDIFIDGQLETWRLTRQHLKSSVNNQKNQKIVIGPWAHQTIGGRESGDMVYKENVGDLIGFAVDDIDINNLDLNDVLQSEIISWFRLTLNNDPHYKKIGSPKVKLPESQKWQDATAFDIRVPAKDFIFPFEDLINFMAGTGGLKNLSIEVRIDVFGFQQVIPLTIDVPALGSPLIPGFGASGQVQATAPIDYNQVPNVRFYVPGPIDDGVAENANMGNYWFATDSFPLTQGITWKNMYLHHNGTVDLNAPAQDEGPKMYVDDPNDPVLTVGGANMIVQTPSGDRVSQGQMQMNSPKNINYCLNRPGVLKFETAPIQDSLCVIGYPKVTLFARSNPSGLTSGKTDADYFVRIVDVYPDGREYFVFEGCVNARARDYAKHIYNTGFEDENIPYSNINIGEIYEYNFEMMPIAYTWGKNHKMKVLIQGSNFPRYQSNPHIPLNDNEFFRRKPGDGQGYVYNNQFMMPRTSVERIYFAPNMPTRIELPIYKGFAVGVDAPTLDEKGLQIVTYPNPADDEMVVSVNSTLPCTLTLRNAVGQTVATHSFTEDMVLEVKTLPAGVYFITVTDKEGLREGVSKITVY